MTSESRKAGGYRSALRSRDLRLLMGSQIISATGSWAYAVALAVFLYERTHSTGWVAAGSLGRFLPQLALSAYGGVVAERFERIRLMMVLNVAALVAQVGLALVVWRNYPAGAAVALAAVTAGILTPYLPSVAAVIPAVTAEDDLAAANALNGTVDNLVVILGPAVGAALVAGGGPALAMSVNALTFAVAAVLVARMSVRSRPSDVTDGGRAGPMRQIADGFRAVATSRTVVVFIAFSALATFVYGADTVLFVPISTQQLHSGTSGYGYLLAGLGVGGIAGASLVNRLASRDRLAAAIIGAMVVYSVPTALLVFVHRPAVAFVLEAVRGAGTLVVDTLAITSLQRSAPKEMVARVFGVFFAILLTAVSLGVVVTPLLLRLGLHAALLVFGLGVPALCLLFLPRLLALDRVAAGRAAALAPRVAILERLDLFAAASRAALESLASAATEERVPSATPVVTEGDVADAFFAVVEGTLDVSSSGEAGGPARWLRSLTAGSYFGEIGLLARLPRTATVTAVTDCTLLRIDGHDFVDTLTNLNASSTLLAGARVRLALTHPSSAELIAINTDNSVDSTE